MNHAISDLLDSHDLSDKIESLNQVLENFFEVKNNQTNHEFLIHWINFQLGKVPSIHKDRWPQEIPNEYHSICVQDTRVFSFLFSGENFNMTWIPSWYWNPNDLLFQFLISNSEHIEYFYYALIAIFNRQLIRRLILSSQRRIVCDLIGEELFNQSFYIFSRMKSLEMEKLDMRECQEWNGIESLTKFTTSIFMSALGDTPIEFRRQILLSLPLIAGNEDMLEGIKFQDDAKKLVLQSIKIIT